MEQFSMFDFIYDKFQIKNKIKLIEFFAGYGSQNLSLKYLGVNYEHHRICEWATKSIQAYNDIHIQDYTDYSQCCTFDEVLNYLFKKGISMNYNEPMTYDQIKRKGEQWCRTTYNNIIATRNLVNIQQVKGSDLEITDTDNYTYLLTYSFPCQDLSLAGKGKGMEKGSGTRSGMLWEVERILKECEQGKLPQVLLMENVPQVHSQENMPHLLLWINELEKLGYKSYWQDLNAKNFGIPQNRERCFMVSILGEYNYTFPKEIPLILRLKDLLEDEVDEKYYLSDKMIKFFKENSKKNEEVGNGFRFKPTTEEEANIAKTITTRAGGRMDDNFIETVGKIDCWHQRGFVYDSNNISPSICATDYKTPKLVKVDNYSPSGHNASSIVSGDGIAPTVMENHGTVTAVVEEKNLKQQMCDELIASGKVQENDVIRHSYSTSRMAGQMKDIQQNNISPTLDTRCDCLGVVTKEYNYLRIRKLTPRECWRLMGVKDEDFDNVCKNQSNSSLYHLAGDSIVTTCLMALFGELLDIDYQTKIEQMINDEVNKYA